MDGGGTMRGRRVYFKGNAGVHALFNLDDYEKNQHLSRVSPR